MTLAAISNERVLAPPKESNSIALLMLLVFLLIPFQRRFHGFFDSLSRSLPLPEVSLPEFFSRKIHLFVSDFLIIALSLLLVFRLKVSLRAFFWEGPSKYLTLLFFSFFLSTSLSITNTYPLQYIRLIEFSFVFLFFNCISCARLKIDLPRLIHRIAWLLILLSLFECLIGIYQYFSQDALGLWFLGEKSPKAFAFPYEGKSLWLLGEIFGFKLSSGNLCRVGGTFLHPNILGGFLFCSLMASFYLSIQEEGSLKRLLLRGMILLQFFSLCISFSRSAVLAVILSTLVWCFLQLKSGGYRFFYFKRGASLIGIVFFSGILCAALLYPQLKARGGILNYNSVSKGADSERVAYMKVAMDLIKEKPLLGVGYNNFQIHANKYQKNFTQNYLHSKVHNIYLLIASESGLIGGCFFLLFLLALLRGAWKSFFFVSHEKTPTDILQARAFLLSTFIGLLFIGACDFYFLENPQGTIPFFGIAGLLRGINTNTQVNT